MRKKICKCGKIVDDNSQCCKTTRVRTEENKERDSFRYSTKWRKLRQVILRRDNFHCQRCLIKYGIVNIESLEVHHIKSRINYPELIWEKSNLITMCKTCNLQLGTNDKLDFPFDYEQLKKEEKNFLF